MLLSELTDLISLTTTLVCQIRRRTVEKFFSWAMVLLQMSNFGLLGKRVIQSEQCDDWESTAHKGDDELSLKSDRDNKT